MKKVIASLVLLLWLVHPAPAADTPEADFKAPPQRALPWVFFWWFNGYVDKPAITARLEALHAKGVGGVVLFQTELGSIPNGPAFMSPEWRELFKFAVSECERLGMKLSFNMCDGWPAGGTWIPREQSPWFHTSSSLVVTGPRTMQEKLPLPSSFQVGLQGYRDFSVRAYRQPDEAAPANEPVVTGSISADEGNLRKLTENNFNCAWGSAPAGTCWFQFTYPQPKTIDCVWVGAKAFMGPDAVEVQTSDDGVTFRPVVRFGTDAMDAGLYPVPAFTTRFCRVVLIKGGVVVIHALHVGTRAEVERIARLAAKSLRSSPEGMSNTTVAEQGEFVWKPLLPDAADRVLSLKDSVDLTAATAADGTLKWNVPAGRWKIVRVGAVPAGLAAGNGYVTDYMNPKAMDTHFDHLLKVLIDDNRPLVGRSFISFHEDNPEIDGTYSWTPDMLRQFQNRRGYDPRPFLAALEGDIVESAEITDRFLQDFRRTVADLIAANHYGEWARLCHAQGMQVQGEAGGQYLPQQPSVDGLMNLGEVDTPVAEFWVSSHWKENQFQPADSNQGTPPGWDEGAQNVNAKQATSAGHVFGKYVISSEAFTDLGPASHWGLAPSDLLLYANIAYCEGINRFTLHTSTVQKASDGKPGYEYGAGTHFTPNQTWWEFSGPFFSFLGRCQALLQRGHFVADVLYYNGDDLPNFIPPKHVDPSLGAGYDYDGCNTEVLLSRLSVVNGRLVLPDGMSYRVLVLPETRMIPLAAAQKIAALVRQGAVVVGPKPLHTLGLKDYPKCESALQQLTDQVWGPCDGQTLTEHAFGQGHVYWGKPLRDVLQSLNVPPDFAVASNDPKTLLDFIHRRDGGTEIYFTANRRRTEADVTCSYRVSGLQPEIWDPFTGSMRKAANFSVKDGITSVPLHLDPTGSCFVVFREKTGDVPARGDASNFPVLSPVQTLAGPWQVHFDPAMGGPDSAVFPTLTDWTNSPEEGIRHYSGKATYASDFPAPTVAADSSVYLDLGVVKNVARVRVNGKDAGIAWHVPFRVGIGPLLHPGTNHLEIDVINLWPNRLIGDAALPEPQRHTRSNVGFGPGTPLQSSGLLGPVRVLAAARGDAGMLGGQGSMKP
ncbi:MAG: glycosyl hydrolase [Verrucomicrobiota bacterium]